MAKAPLLCCPLSLATMGQIPKSPKSLATAGQINIPVGVPVKQKSMINPAIDGSYFFLPDDKKKQNLIDNNNLAILMYFSSGLPS